MEKIEIIKRQPTAHRLNYYNDTISIARTEMVKLLGQPEVRKAELVITLEMHIDCDDCVKIVPFELRVPKVVGDIYNFSQTKIYTTNKDFSQRIKTEIYKRIAELRKAVRKA